MKETVSFITSDASASAVSPPVSYLSAREQLQKALRTVHEENDGAICGFFVFRLPTVALREARDYVQTMRTYASRARQQLYDQQRRAIQYRMYSDFKTDHENSSVVITLEFVLPGEKRAATKERSQLSEIFPMIEDK